jgi:hypothetical protein
MPADVSWYIKDRVLQLNLTGDVTRDELADVATQTAAYIDAAPDQSVVPLVHTLVDATQIEGFPKILRDFAGAYQPMASHYQIGWVLLYGTEDPLMLFIADAASQMFTTRFRKFKTRPEAVAFLQYVDSTLPDLPD